MKLLTLLSYCLAFSYDMHRYLGKNLCRLLENDGNYYINKTLNGESCEEASIWADKIKMVSKYRWSINLHYIDIGECRRKYNKKYIQQECHGEHCIVYGIINSFQGDVYDLSIQENLKLLLHLTQDFFQPLHLYGIYRGGNDLDIIRNKNGYNKTMNLHQMFDGELFEYFIENEKYVPKITQCFVSLRKIDNLLYKHIDNIMGIACKFYERLPDSNYIIFEEFYEPNIIRELLDSYFHFAYNLFISLK